MKFIADLHVHSHFSRATSRTLDPEHLSLWALKKGIAVVGTGDFTHPGWISEIREKLVEAEDGLYRLNPQLQKQMDTLVPAACAGAARFLLSGEISCIYKKNGMTRKLHNLVLMKDFDSAVKLNQRLDRIGNISSDGRPILGLDSRDLLEIVLEVSDHAFFIPAHIWTPWFSLFGSKSGFDTIEECFEDLSGHIYALETGLSSDPPMNRLLSSLDKYLLVSNSDAHSPAKLGREANLFDTNLDYNSIIRAMTDGEGFDGTIEFYPEEGKYHLDGHRKCKARLHPKDTKDAEGACPICGKPVTVGVLHRIHDLADRETPILSKLFFSFIPLAEILSELFDCGPATKKVMNFYEELLSALGPELKILMNTPLEDIEKNGGAVLSEAIDRMRQGHVIRQEGYDGEYGVIKLFGPSEKESYTGQKALFLFDQPEFATTSAPIDLKKQGVIKKETSDGPENRLLSDPVLDPLNGEQRTAVLSGPGSLLVQAGPGTGKTMTLSNRIAYLIREGLAEPGQILALTFTRKAQNEMKQRINELLKISSPENAEKANAPVFVTTFHGFCLNLIRDNIKRTNLPEGFSICPEIDSKKIARECLQTLGSRKGLLKKFFRNLSSLKEASLSGSGLSESDPDIHKLFGIYQDKLRSLGMLDLDDIQVEAMRLIQDQPDISHGISTEYPWIFVDEYQDTNKLQARLLITISNSGLKEPPSEPGRGMFAIGDPDQAIYGFRGADMNRFFNFSSDFKNPGKVKLTKNYRSTQTILKGAADIMGKDEPLVSHIPGNDPIFLSACRTEGEEAEMVVEQIEKLMGGTSYFSLDSGRVDSFEETRSLGFGDIGVLYRLNAQGDLFAEALNRAGIPFVRSGEAPLITRFPVNILWRFFQTLRSPENQYYAKQYAGHMEELGTAENKTNGEFSCEDSMSDMIDQALDFHGIEFKDEDSHEALRRLKQMAEDFGDNLEAFLDTLSLDRGIDHSCLPGDRVALMSLHAAKGLEWPVVFITGCEDQLLPCSLFGEKDEQEEKRLFYVGMTRARRRLILSHSSHRNLNGRRLKMNPSPFLDLIADDNMSPLDRQNWKPRTNQKQLGLFKT
jgi:DNA helicase-2/ATP-dependent DNA helicase PcrA